MDRASYVSLEVSFVGASPRSTVSRAGGLGGLGAAGSPGGEAADAPRTPSSEGLNWGALGGTNVSNGPVGPERRAGRAELRSMLQASEWYNSLLAARLRTMLQGKKVGAIMFLALLTALFLPDLWILCGSNSNLEPDLLLCLIMALFAAELVTLSLVDAAYFLSFFNLMDLIGTVSVVFDISFIFGADATEPHMSDGSGGQGHLLLLRITRAARVGARAGRLSRVLRIFRFLPLVSQPSDRAPNKGIAVVISSQLANLLAARVACLTIFLVVVMPLFDIMSFPQADYALETWVQRVSANLDSGDDAKTVRDLSQMADFFSRHRYGPYKACRGYADQDSVFICEQQYDGWNPRLGEPPREASSLLVQTDNFMVAFNMHSPIQTHAALAMLNMFLVIIIMVFSGMTLSSVVTELAVRPLERMLMTVRHIATTVFNFNSALVFDDQLEEEDGTDIDSASEMILLERVVEKLANIASLQASEHHVRGNADMQEEDIGVLSMLRGSRAVEYGSAAGTADLLKPRRRKRVETHAYLRLEEFGVSQDVFQSWSVNTLVLSREQRIKMAVFTVSTFHEMGEGYVRTKEDKDILRSFVHAAEKEYLPNPFHNFAHAVDVLHGVARMLRIISSEAFLTELEQFVLLIAALGHDLGHPGVNNGFLVEVGHELALKYNDRSPLENMHCAKLYSVVANAETNVFGRLSKEQYRDARKQCIATILHTDMMGHQAMVRELQLTFQVNSEVFTGRVSRASRTTTETDIFNQPETKALVLETILHSADVSNPCRAWEVSQAWAERCLEEFFLQGDQEKERGIPVQFLNDRDKLNRPNSQIGFIEFMIAPFFAAQLRLWPALRELGENLADNIGHWEELWVAESEPSDEEQQKVRARVLKVRELLLPRPARASQVSMAPGTRASQG